MLDLSETNLLKKDLAAWGGTAVGLEPEDALCFPRRALRCASVLPLKAGSVGNSEGWMGLFLSSFWLVGGEWTPESLFSDPQVSPYLMWHSSGNSSSSSDDFGFFWGKSSPLHLPRDFLQYFLFPHQLPIHSHKKSISPMVFPTIAQNLLALGADSTPLAGAPIGALQEKYSITPYTP